MKTTSSSKTPNNQSFLARLWRLLARDRHALWLLIEAGARLVALRVFLMVYGLKRQPRLYGRANKPEVGEAALAAMSLTADQKKLAYRVGWAIWRAEQTLPFDVLCLPQALVARRMLRNRSIASVMFFGVEEADSLDGIGTHAWVVAGPVEVSGFPQAARYRVFASYLPDA